MPRWAWRVSFYGYSALATDRYPPFTMGEPLDSPARLEIDSPQQPRRGLRGGGLYGGGVVGVLVFVVVMLLLFKNRYPRDVFDAMTGFNRWVVRVTAYALLMTPQYPPFRLDAEGRSAASSAGRKRRQLPCDTATVTDEEEL